MEGATTAEIAQRLVITGYTVQDHLKAVFDKVGVRNRRDLARALSSHAARSQRRQRMPGGASSISSSATGSRARDPSTMRRHGEAARGGT